MSELSRRLRDAAKAYPSSIPPARHLYGKAADRIEQLEATLRVAADRIEALEAALREIADIPDVGRFAVDEAVQIARAALAAEQDKQADDELDARIEEMKRGHET